MCLKILLHCISLFIIVISFYFSLAKLTIPWSLQVQRPPTCNHVCPSPRKQHWRGLRLKLRPSSCPTATCFRRVLRYRRALPELLYQCRLFYPPRLSQKQFPRLRCWKIRSPIMLTSSTFRKKSLRHRTYLLGNLVQLRWTARRGRLSMWRPLSGGSCRWIYRVFPEFRRRQWL